MAAVAAIRACKAARADPTTAPQHDKDGLLVIKPGVRQFSDPPSSGLLSPLFGTLSLLMFVGLPLGLLALIGASVFLNNRYLWAFTAIVFSTSVWPVTTHWQAFLSCWGFKTWRQYFDFSFVFTSKLHDNKNYIIAEFPHGVFPLGPLVAGTIVDQLFPNNKVFGLVASSALRVPLLRQFMAWTGGRPATSKNMKRLLDKGSCAVVAGGVAEMFMEDPERERIKVMSRRGFIRVAVEKGVEPVPVYHFGNSQSLFIIGKCLQGLSRKLRASILIMYGRFGLPLPHRVPIFMAVGKPVAVKKIAPDAPGFAEEVERVHAAFVKELLSTYDTYRGMYGWGDRELSAE